MKDSIWKKLGIGVGAVILALFIGILIAKFGVLAYIALPILAVSIILAVLIFRNPFVGFLMIVFFLPFERVPTLPVGGIDIKINTIIGFITLFAWVLALIFNQKENKIQSNALSIPLSLFTISLLLSLTQAVNMTRAIQVLVFVLFTIALSVLAVNMLSSVENLKKVVYTLLASSLVVGVFGLFQFGGDVVGLPQSITLLKEGYTSKVFGFPRIQAFSMEPLYLANYLLIPLCLCLAYFFGRVKVVKTWYLIGLIALLMLIFVLTVSRGGYLGLAASIVVFTIFYFKKVFTWRNLTIVLVLGLVYWGVTFALSKGEYRATEEFFGHVALNDLNKGESTQGRLKTFEFALQANRWHPWVGIGIGNYGPFAKNYPPKTPKTGWDIVNNQFIETFAETGWIGLGLFILTFIILFWRSIIAVRFTKDSFLKATLIGLMAAMVGVLVQYNFFSTLYIIHVWVLVGLLVGVQNLAFKSCIAKV